MKFDEWRSMAGLVKNPGIVRSFAQQSSASLVPGFVGSTLGRAIGQPLFYFAGAPGCCRSRSRQADLRPLIFFCELVPAAGYHPSKHDDPSPIAPRLLWIGVTRIIH